MTSKGYVSDWPDLLAAFDTELNAVPAHAVPAGTNDILWWRCPKGPDHVWPASGDNRLRLGSGCPFCANRKPSVTNDLNLFPLVAAQLCPLDNDGRFPAQVVASSTEKLWWRCPKGPDHLWSASVDARVRLGNGCPCCAGRQVSVTNSLSRPEHALVAAQLCLTGNAGRTAKDIVAGTGEELWWRCPKGPDHRWKASCKSRTGAGTGCGFCAGRKLSVTNSLARLEHADVAAQLCPTGNGGRTPADIVAGTHEKFWWQCAVAPGHRWEATSSDRTRNGTGCPDCVLFAVSAREVALAAELAHVIGLDVADRRLLVAGRRVEVDVLCVARLLVVEYDGAYFHRGKEAGDQAKSDLLGCAGFTVVRVREAPLTALSDADVVVGGKEPLHLVVAAVLDRLSQLRPDVCTLREAAEYRAGGRAVATEAAGRRLAEVRARQAEQTAGRGGQRRTSRRRRTSAQSQTVRPV